MTANELFEVLNERFPGRGARAVDQGGTVFPAAHPDVGDVTIFQDGDEITVYNGNITHSHFASVEELARFLENLFADRVLLWKLWTAGGYRIYDEPVTNIGRFKLGRHFVWSRPL